MSRTTRKQAQQKAADVKARSDANSREMREAAALARTRLTESRSNTTGRRGRGPRPPCTWCQGERKVGPSADAMNIGPPGMCDRCYEEGGLENEHSDYGHEEPVQGCPTCGLSTVGKDHEQPKPAPKQPTGRKRAPKDPSRPSKYEVAAQYGDRIIKGRHEFGYTWQGIAEVLHLIPRGDDVPRSVKVWGHVVVWDAYLIVCAERGIEPRRKVKRGAQKNGNGAVDTTPKHNPNDKPKPETKRQRESRERKEAKLNQPAKNKQQRTRKALALDTLDLPGLRERIEGRTVTYTFAMTKGESTAFVGQIQRIGEIKPGRMAVWFFEQVASDGKHTEQSNERTLYLDQIVEVS